MKPVFTVLMTLMLSQSLLAYEFVDRGGGNGDIILSPGENLNDTFLCLSSAQSAPSRKEYKCAVNGVFSKASSDWLSDQDAAIEQARYRCLRTASQQERFFCNTVSAQCKSR